MLEPAAYTEVDVIVIVIFMYFHAVIHLLISSVNG